MSSISSQIAASAAQSLVQQANVARKKDAVQRTDEQHAQELRDLFEQHVYAVENSAQTDVHRQRVREDEHNALDAAGHERHQPLDPAQPRHIDVEA